MAGRGRAGLAGRTAVAAGAGVVIGWVISVDLDWSDTASRHECAQSTGICIGIAPFVGLALGAIFTVAACWVIMAVAAIRPLTHTVPAAIMLIFLTILIFLRVVSGGRLHPAWAFSLVTAFALASLAATASWVATTRPGPSG